jgi:hypothetical protein
LHFPTVYQKGEGEIATPLPYRSTQMEEVSMGKIFWWTAMIILWGVFFPVVLVIVIGILLAFMMGGGA